LVGWQGCLSGSYAFYLTGNLKPTITKTIKTKKTKIIKKAKKKTADLQGN
jgi:hypothetical protein